MLPFFRKIRWRLAQDNQFFKYSRYAIGEIVLVVVGILIALYINNWNEGRKNHERLDNALVDVQKELVANIKNCRQVLLYLSRRDSIANKVLYDDLSVEDYLKEENISMIAQIAVWYNTPGIQNESYLNYKQLTGNRSSFQDSILSELSSLYNEEKDFVDVFGMDAHNLILANRKVYGQFSWYKDWWITGSKNEEMINFLVNDPRHQAMVIDYSSIVLENLRRLIERFETHALRTYIEIHDYLSETGKKNIDSLYFQYDASQFDHYLGTYVPYENIGWTYRRIDSLVISIQKGKLIITPYLENGQSLPREIIPQHESSFRTARGSGYFRLILDKNKEVEELIYSNGIARVKQRKIH